MNCTGRVNVAHYKYHGSEQDLGILGGTGIILDPKTTTVDTHETRHRAGIFTMIVSTVYSLGNYPGGWNSGEFSNTPYRGPMRFVFAAKIAGEGIAQTCARASYPLIDATQNRLPVTGLSPSMYVCAMSRHDGAAMLDAVCALHTAGWMNNGTFRYSCSRSRFDFEIRVTPSFCLRRSLPKKHTRI